KLLLIKLGKMTFIMAIPTPIRMVPKNNRKIEAVDLIHIPTNKVINPYNKAFSLLVLLAILGAIGDMNAKASSGKLVKKPALQLLIPKSSRITPIIGPTAVIAGRKLKAKIIIPKINRIVTYFFDKT